jgi:hypothetical protein
LVLARGLQRQREEPPIGDGPCCWPLHYGDEPVVLQGGNPSIDLPVLTVLARGLRRQREEPPLGDDPCCWPLHYADEPEVL